MPEAYERVMGRWSRRSLSRSSTFAGVTRARCSTSDAAPAALTFLLAGRLRTYVLTALDMAPSYIAYARRSNSDPRVRFEDADAGHLPSPER